MRIALFDGVNEAHVNESLARAFRTRGHEVYETGRVWQGHRFPDRSAEQRVIEPALQAALEWGPDAILCLRATALRPNVLKRLAATGVTKLVWFPDDPVLYRITYQHVVELYDIALHCGSAAVLDFYERRHGVTGVAFPFWTDSVAFSRARPREGAECDAVFLGNAAGPVRDWRYALMAGLPFDVRLHGRVDADPAGIARGFLSEHADVVAALATARLAVSVPQRFADYRDHRFDFPELGGLGSFDLPSRIVQYAATGLPIVSLDPSGPSAALPEMRVAADFDGLVAEMRGLLGDPARLDELARATHERFERRLTAVRRVELLERLLADPEGWRALPAAARATMWREHDPVPAAPGPPSVRRSRAEPAVIVAGYYGAANAGDELILRAIAERLAGAGVRVVVAAQHPEEVTRVHGLPAFPRTDLAATEAQLRDATAVIVGGGGLLHDYGFARAGGLPGLFRAPELSVGSWIPPVVMARALGRPVHLFALGIGPLDDPDARHLVGWLAAQAASVSVRDADSRGLLEVLPGAPADAEQVADPVYALELGDGPPAPGLARMAATHGLLAVNVRTWVGPGAAGLTERLAAALTAVARRHGLAVVGVPFQAGGARDEGALRRLAAALGDDVHCLVLPWTCDAATIASVLRASSAVVGMRLHAALLAHRVGTPCVGLAYDPKVAAHFDETGRAGACLPLGASAGELASALEAALAEPASGWTGRIAELELDARRALDRLAGRIEAGLPARSY